MDNYRIIADSGSTKTDFCLCLDGIEKRRFSTQGINLVHQSADDVRKTIEELTEAVGHVGHISEVFFYGAGCIGNNAETMEGILKDAFPNAELEVGSDILAAAKALFGNSPGVACILGTGSNSCLYDGVSITDNIPPLGYILGDEGSGTYIGKAFLNAIFKRDLPVSLRDSFFEEYGLSYEELIRKVYKEPLANKFLASITLFIKSHISECDGLRLLVVDCFRHFLIKNVKKYDLTGLTVGAVGSVAYFFQDELRKACEMESIAMGRVLRSPIDGLVDTL